MKPLNEKALEAALTTWFGEAGWRNGCSNAVIESAENAMRDAIRAYMAALDPAPGWQAMDSAPRDGKHILLCVKSGPFFYAVEGGFYKDQWLAAYVGEVAPVYWAWKPTGFVLPSADPALPAAPMSQEN